MNKVFDQNFEENAKAMRKAEELSELFTSKSSLNTVAAQIEAKGFSLDMAYSRLADDPEDESANKDHYKRIQDDLKKAGQARGTRDDELVKMQKELVQIQTELSKRESDEAGEEQKKQLLEKLYEEKAAEEEKKA